MRAELNTRRYLIIFLTVATALVHLVVLGFLFGGVQVLTILNGLGYLALITALYFIPQLAGMRPLIRWALIGYAALTFVLYFFLDPNPFTNVLGLVTKAMEVALIILLLMDRRSDA
jgi:hypothetical protein